MRTQRNSVLIAFLLLLPVFVYSQQGTVKGYLLEADSSQSLPFATVQLKGTNIGVLTDMNGFFTLNAAPGKQTLVLSYVGYPVKEVNIFIKANETLELRLTMEMNGGSNDWRPVVITAGRLEQQIERTVTSMEILPARMVENRVETNLETAVEQVPGVTVIDGQANIRGGSGFSYGAGSRVLVLVDDLPMMAGDANDVKWNFIPLEQMEQVEVMKGASSALFGSSALNGVINMRTTMPGAKPVTQVTTFAGMYDTPKNEYMRWWGEERFISGVNFSHRRRIGNLSLVAGGHYYNDEGYRKGETEQRYRGNVHLRYVSKKIQGLTTGLSANAQQTKGGNFLIWEDDSLGALIPQGASSGLGGNTLSKYTSVRITIDPYVIYSPGKWIHKLRTRYFYADNTNDTEQGSTSHLYYADYLAQRKVGAFNISIGSTGTLTSAAGDLYDSRKGSSLGFYTQADGDFGRLNTSIGIRLESATTEELPKNNDKSTTGTFHFALSNFQPQPLLRLGTNYALFKYTNLRASIGQGFRFPSIAERFIRTRVGDIVIYPNNNLQSESGWSAEVGIKQGLKIKSWKGFIDACYFWTEYQDMMEFTFGTWGNPQTDPLFGLGFKSVNIGNARISGYEFSIAGEGAIGKVKQSILAGYTYINPIQTDFDAKRDTLLNTSKENILKYRFKHLFKFDTETTYKKFFIGISGRYYSRIENIDKAFEFAINGVMNYRATQPKGTWLFDLRAGADITKTIRASFIIRNLFNEEFMTRPADLQAPRTFNLSVRFKV